MGWGLSIWHLAGKGFGGQVLGVRVGSWFELFEEFPSNPKL